MQQVTIEVMAVVQTNYVEQGMDVSREMNCW